MFANVHLDEDSGRIEVKALHGDLVGWASRPGSSWPCSTLARCERGIEVELDLDSGDLLNLISLRPSPRGLTEDALEEVAGDELTAFLDDALTDAAAALLAARKIRTA